MANITAKWLITTGLGITFLATIISVSFYIEYTTSDQNPFSDYDKISGNPRPLSQFIRCTACRATVFGIWQIVEVFRLNTTHLRDLVKGICIITKVMPRDRCIGTTDTKVVTNLLKILKLIDYDYRPFCHFLFDDICQVQNPNYGPFKIKLPPVNRTTVERFEAYNKDINEIEYKRLLKTSIKVVHITDVHIDPWYKVNSSAKCESFLCCQGGTPKKTEERAGIWGSYGNCDIPVRTLISMLQEIKARHKKIDFLMWTGDIPPHTPVFEDRENHYVFVKLINVLFRHFLGPDVRILSSIGNHDSSPSDSFPPPALKLPDEFNNDWLYKLTADDWIQKGVPTSQRDNLKKGAFYTFVIHPGLRIIGINNNYCYGANYWLIVNNTDPAGQLEWLVETLQLAEDNGEKVHIIGHIAPDGVACKLYWAENFVKIIARYSHLIEAQYYGHAHDDQFQVQYDANSQQTQLSTWNFSSASQMEWSRLVSLKPVGISYLTPSASTYITYNPAYRVFTIDGPRPNSTYKILDIQTYFMNLTLANSLAPGEEPFWEMIYSTRTAYNMTDFKPEAWHHLALKIIQDQTLFKLYDEFKTRHSENRERLCENDLRCKDELVCYMFTGLMHENRMCYINRIGYDFSKIYTATEFLPKM